MEQNNNQQKNNQQSMHQPVQPVPQQYINAQNQQNFQQYNQSNTNSPQYPGTYYNPYGQTITQKHKGDSPEHMVEIEADALLKDYLVDSDGDLKIKPANISFATQNPEEKVFVYVRRHWTENITWIVRNILYALLPPIIYLLFETIDLEIGFLNNQSALIIGICYYSLILTNVVKDFFDWYFDPYIFTNERVLHYEFKPFGRYIVSETMLQSIQRINEKVGGVLSNVFGYGTLVITIEGPQEELILKNVPKPTKLRDILSDLVKIAKRYYGDTTG